MDPSEYQIRSCGEKDCKDNGKRNLDEEIRVRLSLYYPGWESPDGTYMVPRTFIPKAENPTLQKGDKTEKDFFDILTAFCEKKEPMFVIHSYKFSEYIPIWESKKPNTNTSNWVMGEHDFVIVHHVHGVVFFQVKATKTSGGHHQAEHQTAKDKLSLEIFSHKLVKAGITTKRQVSEIFKKFPAFVVLPNTQRGQSAHAKDHILYQEDCTDKDAFAKWWKNKFQDSEHSSKINQTIYEHLVMR